MVAPILRGSAAVPKETALRLRGAQTDLYGDVLGGHKILIDPMQAGQLGAIPQDGPIDNLILGGIKPFALRAFDDRVDANKGLRFVTNVQRSIVNLYSPPPAAETESPANLLKLGNAPSVILSMFLTNLMATSSGFPAIAGYGYQTGTLNQWYVGHDSTGSTVETPARLRCRIGPNGGDTVLFTAPVGVPKLLTMHVDRISDTSYRFDTYLDKVRIATRQGAYPFPDPQTAPTPISGPRMGAIQGFSQSWEGVIHRFQEIEVYQGFDAAAWVTKEFDRNAARWA